VFGEASVGPHPPRQNPLAEIGTLKNRSRLPQNAQPRGQVQLRYHLTYALDGKNGFIITTVAPGKQIPISAWGNTSTGSDIMNSETSTQAPKDVRQLLSKWISTARHYAEAHQQEAIALKKWHMRLGAPSVVISAIVGTSIFTAIQHAAQSSRLRWLLAILSMSAAALAALVTFYNYAARSAAHRIASQEYEDVCHRLEILTTSITTMAPADWRNLLEGYSQRLEAIGRRVDLPCSITRTGWLVLKELFHYPLKDNGFNALPRRSLNLRPPLEDFPKELEEVFRLAHQCSQSPS